MTTKEKLLTLFEKNKGVYFSGEEIADKRTAVWKAVNSLRKEGCRAEQRLLSCRRYGYPFSPGHSYRERSFLIGREILVLLPEGTKKASALDVDGECRLIVRYKDGTVAALDSGEVRVQERKHLHTPTE